MIQKKLIPPFLLILILLSSCSKPLKKIDAFPDMYKDEPLSILILPPINETTAADAKEYYSTTILEPFAESGYYIFPVEIVFDVMKNEGVYDIDAFDSLPLEKFKQYFDADAVLFTKIKKWDTSYYVVGGNVKVEIEYKLVSTKDNKVLWSYDKEIKVDTKVNSTRSVLLNLALTAVKTVATDYVPIAKRINYMAISTIPFGKYHPRHNKDQNDVIKKD